LIKGFELSRSAARIWIQGAGDLASGVALRLVRSGYEVLCAEAPVPRVVRRLAAFAEAVFSGEVELEGVKGRLMPAVEVEFLPEMVTVCVDPEGTELPRLRPDALVDARMIKRAPRPLLAGPWPVIGLGPGFLCGRDADLVIETHRGARMGLVIAAGAAAADTGVPGPVAGETSRRLLRSPAAGRLEPRRRIGELVTEGETVGYVAGIPVLSQLDGLLRGLVHPAVELCVGDKVGDVDPRGAAVDPRLVSDKALAVAGGVLEALLRLRIPPCTSD
jgi:xanthine dehydrogenase accessory factor